MGVDKQKGFSLVEMLVVVVIIGIIAGIGIPLFKKAIFAAENMSTYTVLKIMLQEQLNFYTHNSRYARLDELNAGYGNNFGTMVGNELKRGKFSFSLVGGSLPPTDAELKDNFNLVATRVLDPDIYVVTIAPDGAIVQILP